MNSEKNWFQSKTIWGSVVAILAAIGSAFGIPIDIASQSELADALVQVGGAIGALFAIYGRFSASERIR
jgi:cytochrome bd-type quinol oxidase subunit 1